MNITASAPGKLLLLGEYAVLEGAPALVTAVDRRAHVSIRPAAGTHWQLSAPQLGLHNYTLNENGALPTTATADTRQALKLFVAVLHTVTTSAHTLPALDLTIDTAEFFHGEQKLGIGSSAAVAVALTHALLATLEQAPDKAILFDLAASAHRQAQGGVGSNVDIAASVYGGNLIYRTGAVPEAVDLPANLRILPVFTGKAASTPNLVGAVYRLRDEHPELFQQHMQTMRDFAQIGCQTCRDDDALAFMHIAADYHHAMQQLGATAGVEIVSAAHTQLHEIAAKNGAIYKPSGAGGGDIGLLFQHASEQTKSLAAGTAQAGFNPLAMQLCASGAQVM